METFAENADTDAASHCDTSDNGATQSYFDPEMVLRARAQVVSRSRTEERVAPTHTIWTRYCWRKWSSELSGER
ncbi:hypothetical protein AJ79_09414 [Helicocarpus griseus UAMH5409]|uniref:Uncharacterized protein n=1 Tax=Helicocarpus griseus UAMH5409 TaxID=1447875 RepID=A0A2B7WK36_9EURO|nr:hypothetical protein AJ79_09414 [Helicocarpus griseus UAMH5409]